MAMQSESCEDGDVAAAIGSSGPVLGEQENVRGHVRPNLDESHLFGDEAMPNIGTHQFGGPNVFGGVPMTNLGGTYAFGGYQHPNFGSSFGSGGIPNSMMDPYSIGTGDVYTGKSIVRKILTGRENYVTWKLAMEIALSGRSQLSFVLGEYPRPDDPLLAARWQKCNDVIMSWLISSVSESIGEQVMRTRDVVVAWRSLGVRYGGTNLARKSVLMANISNCAQGDQDVATYFDKLGKYWQELDAIKKVKACAGDCLRCKESDEETQEDRVVKFLLGLNDTFAVVRSNIFAMSQVPHIDRVYEMISQEESQKNMKRSDIFESSALYSSTGNQGKSNNMRSYDRGNNNAGKGRSKIQCSHCQKTGHSKENCYKIIGYPSGWKARDVNRPELGTYNANNVVSSNDVAVTGPKTQLTNEQVSQLTQMLEFFKVGTTNQSQVQITQMAGPESQDCPRDWKY